MLGYLNNLTFRKWAKIALSVWAGFVALFAFVILYLFVSGGPPPQAEQQGVLWFYVRHWLAGVFIFPVYILVVSAIVWIVVRIAGSTRKFGAQSPRR